MSEEPILAAALGGEHAAFEQLVAEHRRELFAHCYRMLGSVQDAEDAVQESLLNAWRGISGFQGRSSLRTWLYRVTTNTCLRLADKNARRMLSPELGPPRSDTSVLGEPVSDPVWIEPWPSAEPAGSAPDPAAAYIQREGVELAFIAALQHLPSTQRTVLILRDVMAFSANEVADLLETSRASVNSALQRARATIKQRMPERSQQVELATLGSDGRRRLVDQFMDAWERADVDALLSLLTDDVRFTMPPLPAWFDGKRDVGRFLADRVFATPWRLTSIQVNGQLGFACYQGDGQQFRLGAINVLHLRDGRVCWLSGFVDPSLQPYFPIPSTVR